MDNGACRALVPLENKRSFLEVSGDIVERVDPIFFRSDDSSYEGSELSKGHKQNV